MNRNRYKTFVGTAFLVGFALYWAIAHFGYDFLKIPIPKVWMSLVFGLPGALLIGGLTSGILMFIAFIKKRSTGFQVLCGVLFPLTFVAIACVGILAVIPYYICNLVKLRQNRLLAEEISGVLQDREES